VAGHDGESAPFLEVSDLSPVDCVSPKGKKWNSTLATLASTTSLLILRAVQPNSPAVWPMPQDHELASPRGKMIADDLPPADVLIAVACDQRRIPYSDRQYQRIADPGFAAGEW
jgi:hypothetical protein